MWQKSGPKRLYYRFLRVTFILDQSLDQEMPEQLFILSRNTFQTFGNKNHLTSSAPGQPVSPTAIIMTDLF